MPPRDTLPGSDPGCAVCPPSTPDAGRPLSDEEAAIVARALAHPVRVEMIRRVGEASACYCGDLCQVLDLAQSTVSQHLKVLKEAGLVRGTRQGTAVCYCVEEARLQAFRRWAAGLMLEVDGRPAIPEPGEGTSPRHSPVEVRA
ncbi:MAG: ArsR family transcriptional regulator [Gemmatimonadales bacterium]|nr:MAG: ArsR family transcriptional regulator [Gemmatimonadales bacterium]